MRYLILIAAIVAPSFSSAEKIEIEWPDRKFQNGTCIMDIDPESSSYQVTLMIFDVVFKKKSETSSLSDQGYFYYGAWPVGDYAVKGHKYTGSMMVLFPMWNFHDDERWVEMPSCP